jgi:hypothetical protein
VVSPGGSAMADGCTFMIRTDLRSSPGFGVEIGEVQTRVSVREPKVRAGIMVRHGSSTPLPQMPEVSATYLSHVVSESIFDIALLVQATLQQRIDSSLGRGAVNRGETGIPLRRNFCVRG